MRNLTKRRLVSGAFAFSLLAAACTSAPDPTTTTTTTAPTTTTTTQPTTTTTTAPTTTTTLPEVHGGVAIVGLATEPATLNPFFTEDPEVQLISQAMDGGRTGYFRRDGRDDP